LVRTIGMLATNVHLKQLEGPTYSFYEQCDMDTLALSIMEYFLVKDSERLKLAMAKPVGAQVGEILYWGLYIITNLVHRVAKSKEAHGGASVAEFADTPPQSRDFVEVACGKGLMYFLLSIFNSDICIGSPELQNLVCNALLNVTMCSSQVVEQVGASRDLVRCLVQHALWDKVGHTVPTVNTATDVKYYREKRSYAFSTVKEVLKAASPETRAHAVATLLEPEFLSVWVEQIRTNVKPGSMAGLATLCTLSTYTDTVRPLVEAGMHTAVADLVAFRTMGGKHLEGDVVIEAPAQIVNVVSAQAQFGLRVLMQFYQEPLCAYRIRHDLHTNIGLLRTLFNVYVDYTVPVNTEEVRNAAMVGIMDAEALFRLTFLTLGEGMATQPIKFGEWFKRVAMDSAKALPEAIVSRPKDANPDWTPPVCSMCLHTMEAGSPDGAVVRTPCFCLIHRDCLLGYLAHMLEEGKDVCVTCQSPIMKLLDISWPTRTGILMDILLQQDQGTSNLNDFTMDVNSMHHAHQVAWERVHVAGAEMVAEGG